jgi:two-component system, sensor histidine kinase
VCITCEAADNDVLLTIADTGIGIATQDQERVFREFVQLHNPQRSRDKGVGLGLAIVRHISLLLGHPITIDSCPGRGTRMIVRLPRVEAAAPEAERGVTAPTTDLTGRTVWIVEDDTAVCEALRAYFGTRGCECTTAKSRCEIEELQRAGGVLPDYVLIDDMLSPHESGLDVARWLATQLSPARILMMTGNADPRRLQELKASSFNALRKPIHADTLNEWVDRIDADARR